MPTLVTVINKSLGQSSSPLCAQSVKKIQFHYYYCYYYCYYYYYYYYLNLKCAQATPKCESINKLKLFLSDN